MPIREIDIRGITWIDGVNLDKKSIYEVVKDYDFHELDIEACLEENQRARVDKYDDYLFIIFNFPKYNSKTGVYELNEFNVFLGKDFIITFRTFEANHIDKLFAKYSKLDIEDDASLKMTTGYILYEMMQSMLEKMFKVLDNNARDLKLLEKEVFINTSSNLVKKIMVKKRNIIYLKHMFKPQVSVLKLVELNINNLFKGRMEVYFEDLEDKLDYIVNYLNIQEENIISIEDAFTSLINVKTNNVIKFLTLFSTFLLPLTLITSFYGMNITLPYQDNPEFFYTLFTLLTLGMVGIYFYMKSKGKI
ncbi:MAG: magnesium transporter CorA family protein [Candidatus Gracilibacteria bacterium]|nr:magnesium transporter CorA family protein [Candidatus Gracilibacteria bacterium]